MIDRALFFFVAACIVAMAVAACYRDDDPHLPPVYPDYPAMVRDAGRG